MPFTFEQDLRLLNNTAVFYSICQRSKGRTLVDAGRYREAELTLKKHESPRILQLILEKSNIYRSVGYVKYPTTFQRTWKSVVRTHSQYPTLWRSCSPGKFGMTPVCGAAVRQYRNGVHYPIPKLIFRRFLSAFSAIYPNISGSRNSVFESCRAHRMPRAATAFLGGSPGRCPRIFPGFLAPVRFPT